MADIETLAINGGTLKAGMDFWRLLAGKVSKDCCKAVRPRGMGVVISTLSAGIPSIQCYATEALARAAAVVYWTTLESALQRRLERTVKARTKAKAWKEAP